MKKLFLMIAAVAVSAVAFAQQPDTLDYRNDYYAWRRNLQEGVTVAHNDLVMLGNSITERGYWSEYFRNRHMLNRGIGGDCVSGMIARIAPIVAGQPRKIFIMAGVNDLIFSKITPEKLIEQYGRLLDIIRQGAPHTKIYIQSVLPLDESQNAAFAGKNVSVEAYNALLQRLASERGLTYIDIWTPMQRDGKMPAERTIDGIHLNAAGYAVWIEVLKPYIN